MKQWGTVPTRLRVQGQVTLSWDAPLASHVTAFSPMHTEPIFGAMNRSLSDIGLRRKCGMTGCEIPDAKQYRDVYQALSVGSLPDGKVFFHDLTGSGLHAGSGGPMVIMNQGVSQTVFDGNWNDRKMTQKAYEEKLVQADATYSRLLRLLIEQAKRMP